MNATRGTKAIVAAAPAALALISDPTPPALANLAERTIAALDRLDGRAALEPVATGASSLSVPEWQPSQEDLDAFAAFERARAKEYRRHLSAHDETSDTCTCFYYASRWTDRGPKPDRGLFSVMGWVWRNDIRTTAIRAIKDTSLTAEALMLELHAGSAVCWTRSCRRGPMPPDCRERWGTNARLTLGYAQREQRWWRRRRWPDLETEPDMPPPPAFWTWD